MKILLPGLAAALLTGCIYTPQLVKRYDQACDIEVRQMVLTAQQTGFVFQGVSCSDNSCLTLLAAEVLLVPVSAVVSGSIVLVGNTVFWMQRRGQCPSTATADRATSPDLGVA